MNNVPPQYQNSANKTPSPSMNLGTRNNEPQSAVITELEESPFNYWQRTMEMKAKEIESLRQAPKRTVSLGPRQRPQIAPGLQKSPFITGPETKVEGPKTATRYDGSSFDQAARELRSSLTELNKLIEESTPPINKVPSPRLNRGPPLTVTKLEENDDDDDSKPPPRWQWQEDLSNWKSSSSVNDLRSAFEGSNQRSAPSNSLRLDLPKFSGDRSSGASGGELPPRSASPSVLRQKFELASMANNGNQQKLYSTSNQPSGYTIKRTTSVSSSNSQIQRPTAPALRNPYRR